MDGAKSEYKIWAVDNIVYGPVSQEILIAWINEERVPRETWVYKTEEDVWRKADAFPELKSTFATKGSSNTTQFTRSGTANQTWLRPGSLRRIKIFATFSDSQLTEFAAFLQVVEANAYATVVKQGDPGDAMFFIMEGEVRVRLMIDNKETTLTTLNEGEFFGEFCLFDHGPRSADIIANKDSVLAKMPAAMLHKLCEEKPELATIFLLAIGKTLTARMRADNKRIQNLVSWSRAAHF